jgi:hypothetical protein
VGGAESVAGEVVQLTRGNLMVLCQKMDQGGKQDICGMLRASSTRWVWSGLWVPLLKDMKLIFKVKNIACGVSFCVRPD